MIKLSGCPDIKAVGTFYCDSHNHANVFKKTISPAQLIRNHHKRLKAMSAKGVSGFIRLYRHPPSCHPLFYNGVLYAYHGAILNAAELRAKMPSRPVEIDSEILGPLIDSRELWRASGPLSLIWTEIADLPNLYLYHDQNNLEVLFITRGPDVAALATTIDPEKIANELYRHDRRRVFSTQLLVEREVVKLTPRLKLLCQPPLETHKPPSRSACS